MARPRGPIKHLKYTLAEFCCNNHTNASTGLSPFFASFGHHPRLNILPESETALARDTPELISRMQLISQQCNENISLAQEFQASYANENRLPAPRYRVGDRVFLSLKNLRLSRPTKKLDHIRAGPWRITVMKTPLVAKLDLPPQWKIDNNFHVNLLKPAFVGFLGQQQLQPPAVEISDGDFNTYEVETILDSRIRRKKVQYLVRWTGYEDTTWEPLNNLTGCGDLLKEFHSLYPSAACSTELAD